MRWRLPAQAALVLVVAVQALCSLFFVWDILAGVVGFPRQPLSWKMREMMEMGASIGLVLGVALGAVLLFTTLRRNRSIATQLRLASGAFAELLDERFRTWALTPSERDVAWFTIKDLPIAEIARLRQTSEGLPSPRRDPRPPAQVHRSHRRRSSSPVRVCARPAPP